MAGYRRRAATNSLAARVSAVAFAWLGTVATLVAAFAILVGAPDRAHDLAPLGREDDSGAAQARDFLDRDPGLHPVPGLRLPLRGPGDVIGRFGEIAPVLAAVTAACVAAIVAAFIGSRRLDAAVGGLELFVLGGVVLVCILGMSGRVGHTLDGSVMRATLGCVAGGATIAAGGIVALLGRE